MVIFEIIKKFVKVGYVFVVEKGVGDGVLIWDVDFIDVGVEVGILVVFLKGVDVVFVVCKLDVVIFKKIVKGMLLVLYFDLSVEVVDEMVVFGFDVLLMEFVLCIIWV